MDDMTVSFGRRLAELGESVRDVVVLDGDLNTSTRTAFFLERFPERFVQVGIAEQNLMGIAAGLSIGGGFIPFAVTFASFAGRRTCDQVSIGIAYQKANVKIVGTYAGISLAKGGATHQSVEDVAIMRSVPGMRIADPGWPAEIGGVLEAATAHAGPVYIRIAAGSYPDLPAAEPFSWGRGELMREGTDVTLVSTGIMVHSALAAATELSRAGVSAAVVHCTSVEPLDAELVCRCAAATGLVVTLENHGTAGGLGDAVSEAVAARCPVPVRRLGVRASYGQTARQGAQLFALHGLDVPGITATVKDAVRAKRGWPRGGSRE